MANCKFISCFSYKGGAGRSTLAINVIPFLAEKLGASEDHPLVLVDMDIDSCGLTYLFDLHNDKRIDEDSVQYWFSPKVSNMPKVDEEDEIESALKHNMFKKLFPVGKFFGKRDREILCLPASPGVSISGDNNNSSYDAKLSNNLVEFRDMCKEIAVGVLFDSAVGDQLTAVWSNKSSDYIMCCMRPTKQFRDGTNRFFDKFDTKVLGKKIIVIPNVVPTDKLSIKDERGQTNHYPSYAKERICEDFADNVQRKNNTYILDLLEGGKFGVPKVDRFMWQEGVLRNSTDLSDLEHVALDRYEEIALIIAKQ